MIEEQIKDIKRNTQHLIEEVFQLTKLVNVLKNHIIPEKQDTTKLSEKVAHELSYGDEPRHYKKCRRCGKKPCECETEVEGQSRKHIPKDEPNAYKVDTGEIISHIPDKGVCKLAKRLIDTIQEV